jgi:hypothetical protein
MITVLIVISWQGHHPSYCAELIRACDAFSRRIYIICPAEANPRERVGGPLDLIEKMEVVFHANRAAKTGFKKFTDIAADFRELRLNIASIREANPGEETFIFHTSLDSLFIGVVQLPLLWLCIRNFLPWPFSGLMLAPERRWPLSSARAKLDRRLGDVAEGGAGRRAAHSFFSGVLTSVAAVMRWVYLLQKNQVLKRSWCQQIALQDERYADWLRIKTGKAVEIYPETTSVQVSNPPPELVRQITARKQGRVVVGLLGELSRRKCVDVLLDVIANHDTEGFLFVIAGECYPATFLPRHLAFLENEIHWRDNVLFSPQTVPSESDFNAVIESCDIVYCVYRDHPHSSNVISKAAAFQKPVLVNRDELMAKRVKDYRIGCVLPFCNALSCIQTLRQMTTPGQLTVIQQSARFVEYTEDNSFESLQKTMGKLSAYHPHKGNPHI